MGRDGTGDGDVFLEWRGLIDEHVAAAGEEALVGVHELFARDVRSMIALMKGTGCAGSLMYSSKVD